MKTLSPNPDRTIFLSAEVAKVHRVGTGGMRLTGLLLAVALGAASVVGGSSRAMAQTASPTPQPLIVADFNHDGIPDALVLSTTAPTATIAFGSVPYGSFGAGSKAVAFPAGCANPLSGSLVVGDFNGDGLSDIAFFCAGISGTMLGNGDGTFAAPALLSDPVAGTAVVGDFNKDGKLDIAILVTTGISAQSQAIQFLAGNGDGTFQEAVLSNLTVNSYTAMVATDLNADGYPDLVLLNSPSDGTPSVDVYGNNQGGGTFGSGGQGVYSPNTSATIATGGATTILTGNVFGALTTDVVVPVPGANGKLYVYQNGSSGTTFSFHDPVTVSVANLTGAQAGKFTGSGFTDVAVSNGTTISVLANDGTGNLGTSYATLALTSTSSLFSVADANGDGYSDIYTASLPSSGALQLGVALTTGTATATSQPFSLAVGTKAIGAAWVGNVNFTGSNATGNQIVVGVASVTALASSKNPSLVGDSVTFSGRVMAGPNVDTDTVPTGTVVLMDGAAMLASGPVDGNGNYSFTTTTLTQATHTITANYAGDGHFAPSTATLMQVVNHPVAVAPNLNWATPAGIAYGTALTGLQLNATAADATGVTIPGMFVYTPASGAVLAVGPQTLSVTFTPTDLSSFTVATKTVSLVVSKANPVITWATPANITYGTALSGAQLNATVAGVNGAAPPGVLTYSPALGTVLAAGPQTLSATFTPTDLSSFTVATKTVSLVVSKANPVITWATPASITYGTALSGTQLNATAAGVNGAALPGVFTYTPAAGTVPGPGTHALSVSFTATNAVDYNVGTGTVNVVVTGVTLSSFTPSTAPLGSGATTVMVSGAGFVSNSVVQVNGTAIQTTLVNPTTLTAVIPASDFLTVGTLQITVFDPSAPATSTAATFTVTAPAVAVVLSAPPTVTPGSQPTIDFTITKAYPVDITATLTLGFAASTSPAVDDPSIQFAEGGRTLSFVVPANTVTVPTITLQAGTVAGTITVPIILTAGGVNVTPTDLAPAVIVVPATVPTISSATVTRSGTQLTVVMHGFSNTREMVNAKFHFTPAAGATLGTTDLTITADTIFNTNWFQTTGSDQYGSTFTYTQIFNTSDDATTIGSVDVTLTNTVGASDMKTTQ